MKVLRLSFVTVTVAVTTACTSLSAGNLFSHYSAQNRSVYSALLAGKYPEAQAALADSLAGPILDNMEKGRVNWLNGQYSDSKSYFEQSE